MILWVGCRASPWESIFSLVISAPRAIMWTMRLQHTFKAIVRPGEESGYVAECVEIPVVSALHTESDDLAELGLATNPGIIVTYELEPLGATA